MPLTTLQAFDASHLPLLSEWLRQPHVAPWYPRPQADLARAVDPPAAGSHALIAHDGVALGYLRWQRVERATLDVLGLQEIPANSVDIDILLGDARMLGKGVGVRALELLAAELRADPEVPVIGLTTSVNNTGAHRAFAKAGFHIARQYDPGVVGLCHLMLRDLRLER